MPRSTPRRPTRRKAPSRRGSSPSAAALREIIRPIVRELMVEYFERVEDLLDAQDAREALAEGGGITQEKLRRNLP